MLEVKSSIDTWKNPSPLETIKGKAGPCLGRDNHATTTQQSKELTRALNHPSSQDLGHIPSLAHACNPYYEHFR